MASGVQVLGAVYWLLQVRPLAHRLKRFSMTLLMVFVIFDAAGHGLFVLSMLVVLRVAQVQGEELLIQFNAKV